MLCFDLLQLLREISGSLAAKCCTTFTSKLHLVCVRHVEVGSECTAGLSEMFRCKELPLAAKNNTDESSDRE